MINPTSGRILFNGVDIREIPSDEYFRLFSPVFLDFKLFAFKVRDNISAIDDSNDITYNEKQCKIIQIKSIESIDWESFDTIVLGHMDMLSSNIKNIIWQDILISE